MTQTIKCPECETVQQAEVLETWPFWSYVQECGKCKFIIMESEWNQVTE